MDENQLNKLERITVRLFLIAVLIWITFVLYQSCSASFTFVKGENNTVRESQSEQAEADGDALRVLGKGDSSANDKVLDTIDQQEFQKLIDSING